MTRGGLDYSQFEKFVKNFEGFSSQFRAWLEAFLLKEASTMLRLVRPRTPVKTGNLRRNWTISEVILDGDDLLVNLENLVEYASFMEDGFTYHTKQGDQYYEGFHMARISLEMVKQQLPAHFTKDFKAWLKTLGWEG